MTIGAARGLPVPGLDLDEAMAGLGWRPVDGTGFAIDWPTAEYVTVQAAWTSGAVTVALVDDEFILRRYLRSNDPDGPTQLHRLVDDGLVLRPSALFAQAQPGDGWAEAGDTLYDVVAGCIDSDSHELVEIWRRRLADAHPLVRLAASWAGPYLYADGIAEALELTTEDDDELQVRSAAAVSLQVIRNRAAP